MPMTLAELLALFPDNTTGEIDADDLRTLTTELFNGVLGPPGPTGAPGAPGAAGAPGEKWFFGPPHATDDSVPGSAIGDLYLDTAGQYEEKNTSGFWIALGNLKGPKGDTASWTVTGVKNADYTAAPWDMVRVNAAATITLPAAPLIGDQVAVVREGNVTVTVVPNAGQTINGQATSKMQASAVIAYSVMTLTYVAAGLWRVEASAQTDASLGFETQGALSAQGGLNVGVVANSAALTLTSGHSIVVCATPGGAYTITFGNSLRAGQVVWIYNGGSATITLAANGTGTVAGATGVAPGQTVQCLVVTAGANPGIVVLGTSPAVAQYAAWDEQTYFTPGSFTWNKPAGAVLHQIIVMGSGGGGGSGARKPSGTLATGGAGGGGGGRVESWVSASLTGSSETVTVGAGPLGAVPPSGDGLNGLPGGAGNPSQFGATNGIRATGGGGGGGGTATGAAAGGGGGLSSWLNGGAGASSAAAGGLGPSGAGSQVSGGGGAGGGLATSPAAANGGASGGTNWGGTPGTAGVASGGAAPGMAAAPAGMQVGQLGSGGGGGGASNTTIAGQTGADGRSPGGGGGGGGASLNGFAAGGGGKGGDGYVIVRTLCIVPGR